MHIKVQREPANPNGPDTYRTVITNQGDFDAYRSLKQTCRVMESVCDTAVMLEHSTHKIKLVMDMAQHERCPTRRVLRSLLGPRAPPKFLSNFTRLQIDCVYAITDGREDNDIDQEVLVQRTTATYAIDALSPSATEDVIDSLDIVSVWNDTSDESFSSIACINEGIRWAIENPLIAQGLPTPYLTGLTSKGLHTLGKLFTVRAGAVAMTRHNELRIFDERWVETHEHSMKWLQKVQWMKECGDMESQGGL
jgi:hypothetical protein